MILMDGKLSGWYRPSGRGRRNHYLVAGIPLCNRRMTLTVERVRTNYNFCRDCQQKIDEGEVRR